ncbi:MAG: class II aldolase/adducin family protein [Lachnospiraceae bacterium]|nr:class II aldolase/adducin family protein [Lachnospiraceae bacterium]
MKVRDEQACRRALVEYGKRLAEDGLIEGTWGNLSVRLDEETMLITPSGLGYERLREEDICKVRLKDGSWTGTHKPSSERRLHAGIYRAREDVWAVVHTHAAGCVTFAACGKDLRVGEETFVCAAYGVSGSGRLAKNCVKALGRARGCLLAHHGVVCVGGSLEEAYEWSLRAEKMAGEWLDGAI